MKPQGCFQRKNKVTDACQGSIVVSCYLGCKSKLWKLCFIFLLHWLLLYLKSKCCFPWSCVCQPWPLAGRGCFPWLLQCQSCLVFRAQHPFCEGSPSRCICVFAASQGCRTVPLCGRGVGGCLPHMLAPQGMQAGSAVPPALPGQVRGSEAPLCCCGAQLEEWAWVNMLMLHCLHSA